MAQTKEALLQQLNQLEIPVTALEPFVDVGEASIYLFTVQGSDSLKIWRKLNGQVAQTGYSPVIISGDRGRGNPLDQMRYTDSLYPDEPDFLTADDIIRQSAEIDAQAWLESQKKQWEVYAEENPKARVENFMGEWAAEQTPYRSFVSLYDRRTREWLPTATVALVPTTIPWQIPAYFQFGDFNDCPPPAVHCAVLRMWWEKYGAKPVIVRDDVLELTLKYPPTTREAALQLAEEQFYYCTDLVHQGVGTLRTLASGLINGTTWYFWWD